MFQMTMSVVVSSRALTTVWTPRAVSPAPVQLATTSPPTAKYAKVPLYFYSSYSAYDVLHRLPLASAYSLQISVEEKQLWATNIAAIKNLCFDNVVYIKIKK